MNVSNSTLFKDYARSVLRPETSQSTQGRSSSSSGIMGAIVQHLINRTRLEVLGIRISNAMEYSFNVNIECRITGSGPIRSTLSPMELDFTFNSFAFAKIKLPEIRTSLWGTRVVIEDQTINIADAATYNDFIRSILVDDETNFQLENGECAVWSLGLTSNCDYNLDVPITALGGPRMSLQNLSRWGEDGISAIFRVNNPSPVELEYGMCEFELRNDKGEKMAELKGELKIAQGQSDLILEGTIRMDMVPSDKIRLVGVGVEGPSWCNVTLRHIDVVVDGWQTQVGWHR